MQTECSIMEHTTGFAANNMQPVNKLQCHVVISCCCHTLVSPSLSICDFVESSLKTSEVNVWLLSWTYSWSMYMLSSYLEVCSSLTCSWNHNVLPSVFTSASSCCKLHLSKLAIQACGLRPQVASLKDKSLAKNPIAKYCMVLKKSPASLSDAPEMCD